jgi:hypothetical protein
MLQRFILLLMVSVLAGCSGPRLPFEKDSPLAGEDTALVHPPWEAFVKAGPGAEKDIDLETLNGPGGLLPGQTPMPPPLIAETEAAGQEVAPDVSEAPPIKTKTEKSEKKGVAIKSVAVPSVQGAAGKGNAELTEAMRQVLQEAGWPVVNAPAANALTIRGKVKMVANGPNQTVQLQWVVATPDGKELGNISQSNDVPAGSLDKGWGENARFATEAAAEGIFKLIQSYR